MKEERQRDGDRQKRGNDGATGKSTTRKRQKSKQGKRVRNRRQTYTQRAQRVRGTREERHSLTDKLKSASKTKEKE